MKIILLAGLLLIPSFHASAELTVQFSPRAIAVNGVTRGGAVALLSVARERAYYMASVVSRHEMLTDSDRDGSVHYEVESGISLSSIWIFVDVASGAKVVVSPPGGRLLEMQQRGGRGKAVESVVGTLDVDRTSVDVLVVQRGAGAWFATARDGHEADRDGQFNGKLRIDLSQLRGLQTTAAPPHKLGDGDVVALIDAVQMEYWVVVMEGNR